MIYKKSIVLLFLCIVAAVTSCSKSHDINGIYVHYSGDQQYYTLTISEKNNDSYDITLEGVPLDMMQEAPWSIACSAKLVDQALQCDDLKIRFHKDYEFATALYKSGQKQVFVSSKKNIKEERKVYGTDN